MQFDGFENLSANYLYCPNQFFDLCLSNYSRGTVRLVAYMLRKTLGWLDKDGNPVEQNISISYNDLINEAGISRGAIRKAIDDAVSGGFITCLEKGKLNRTNKKGGAALFVLKWSKDDRYHLAKKQFDGFFAGEGHRTPIPNSFFDQVIKQEPLSVVKVVGTVLRHTVGYQNQFGGRRQVAPLSYSYILKYSNLSDRSTLSQAIQYAIDTGYIRCVKKGAIDTHNGTQHPSTYAIRWQDQANNRLHSPKTRPEYQRQSKNQTENSSESRPTKQSKNQTKEKPQENNTDKQQNESSAVAISNTESIELLQQAGFDLQTAKDIAGKRGLTEIKQQIEWLPYRNPDRNSLGMLRKAIEQNWSKPEKLAIIESKQQHRQKQQLQTDQASIEEQRILTAKRDKKRLRERLLPIWNGLSTKDKLNIEQEVFDELNSNFLKERFRKNQEYQLQLCLDFLAEQQITPKNPSKKQVATPASLSS